MDTKKTAGAIEEEAATWVVRLDRDGRSEALLVELENWLAKDNRHAGALLRAEAAWMLLEKAKPAGTVVPARQESFENSARRNARWISLALAAGLSAIAIGFGSQQLEVAKAPIHRSVVEDYRTEQGEISVVGLADGSSASMNSSSALTVEYRPDLRALTLSQGEVWFDVAKDVNRPFVVAIGDARVRAVGTGFAVQFTAEAIDVSVTEGTVEVWTTDAPTDVARLHPGHGVTIAAERVGPVEQRGIKQVEERLQWRYRRIDLAGQTLRQAVDKFNQYNRRKLEIADPRIADEQLHGVFQLNDIEGFARAVQTSLSVPVDFSQPERIVLGAGPRP